MLVETVTSWSWHWDGCSKKTDFKGNTINVQSLVSHLITHEQWWKWDFQLGISGIATLQVNIMKMAKLAVANILSYIWKASTYDLCKHFNYSCFIEHMLIFLQDEANSGLTSRIKELEEERGRLHRTNASQQSQIDKFKSMAEEAKGKSDSLETQLSGVRKVRIHTMFTRANQTVSKLSSVGSERYAYTTCLQGQIRQSWNLTQWSQKGMHTHRVYKGKSDSLDTQLSGVRKLRIHNVFTRANQTVLKLNSVESERYAYTPCL